MTEDSSKKNVLAIHTLEARSNVMFEVVRDYFGLTDLQMRREIQGYHAETVDILRKKGIDYAGLKNALVPQTDKDEAAFIFDADLAGSDSYGLVVAEALLPLLDKKTKNSFLAGDLIGFEKEHIFELVEQSLVFVDGRKIHRITQPYCVYINNLSEKVLSDLHSGLSKYPFYLGYIPATFGSLVKTYLSAASLVSWFVKNGRQVIMGHEDDVPDEENVNMHAYPYEENGFEVKSIQSSRFGLFLDYKIERQALPEYENDTEFSLNAISDQVIPLADCKVVVAQAKHDYLHSKKGAILKNAKIDHLSNIELENLIAEKLQANYIYNLVFLTEHNVAKFNIILEIPDPDEGRKDPFRLVGALKYLPEKKELHLITLF